MSHSLEIIFENNDYLIVDKPSGLVVNRSQTTPDGTLQDLLEERMPLDKPAVDNVPTESDFYARNGIVHRLDKDTSGVLVVAKNVETFDDLQSQFKKREVEKEYLALVYGELKDDLLEIDAPIKRDPQKRTRYVVSKSGKSAFTTIRFIKSFDYNDNPFTFVKCMPKTGRTHQLRVHLCALGHTVVGDPIYAGAQQKRLAARLGFKRLMLHAHILRFHYQDKLVEYKSQNENFSLAFFDNFLHYER